MFLRERGKLDLVALTDDYGSEALGCSWSRDRLIYKHFKNTTREFALIRAGPGHCVDLNQQEKPVGARGLEFWCR